ncbi:MAG: FAD-dependent oxidoreductase [Bacillota bacterium]|nr:FAD-dependent oxidoreductase [Bacillota bacterium]
MNKTLKLTDELELKGSYDIIVAGGGVAGVAAAVSAKRQSKKVLLIEKSLSFGGLATIGLINLFVPMCNGRGVQIIKGMAEELLRLSIKYGFDTIPEEWKNGEPGPGAKTRYVTRFSAPIFTIALTNYIQEEGVCVLFDSVVSKPIMDGGHCQGVVVENKSGREYYEAKMFIDTTGDADLIYRAGIPCVDGKNYFTYLMYGITMNTLKKALETGNINDAYTGFAGGGIDLYGHNQPSGVPLYRGTTAQEVTDYIKRNHKVALERIASQDRTKRDITHMPAMPQFRTTRRINGNYTLKNEDVYKHFDDSIGAICDFELKDRLFEMPYGTLVKDGFDNLITAGRSTSGEGYAWDVMRVIPPAIISGQAAGEAAALAIETGKSITDIDIKTLQDRLAGVNVMIHFDDALIPQDTEKTEKGEDIGHI